MDLVNKENRMAATPFGCGQCLPCRINKAREWTTRIILEGFCHKDNTFITLTYNNKNLPKNKSLDKTDLQKFLKKFRQRLGARRIRYFGCGEYGSLSERPHYHLIVFNTSRFDVTKIQKSWDKGFVYVGDLSPHSARYVCQYVTKKYKSDKEWFPRKPEFGIMSKMDGGLGINAVYEIADKIFQKPFLQNKLIREVSIGKTKLPLGRYLSEKLYEILELPEEIIERATFDYQEKMYKEYLKKGDEFFAFMRDINTDRARAIESKHKNFKSRGTI